MFARLNPASIADRLIESVWLATLLALPLFFNIYTERVFEADKILLLRCLAALAGGIVLVRVAAGGFPAHLERLDPRSPVIVAVLGLTAVYVASACFSIDAAASWWGTYDRNYGVITWLALLGILLAGAFAVRSWTDVETALDAMILSATAVAGYALAQSFGLDPITWRGDLAAAARPASTAGNPIFAAAFCAMILPPALARGLAAADSGKPAKAAPYFAAVVVLGAAIGAMKSRGPALALSGAAVMMMLLLVRNGFARALRTSAVVLAVTAAVGAALAMRSVSTDNRAPQRDHTPSTATTRVIIWDAVSELIQSSPGRMLLGHGPDTLFVAFAPHYPASLGQYERRDVSPDRAHNQTLDALAMTGIAGCALELFLFLSLFYAILRRTFTADSAWSKRFVILTAAGALLGAAATLAIDGGLRFAGLGIPAGACAGLLVAVLWSTPAKATSEGDHRRLLISSGLFAALLCHFAEIQVGIDVIMTKLAMVAMAAIAIAAPVGDSDDEPAPADPAMQYGAWAGLLLVLLTFGIHTPTGTLSATATCMAVAAFAFWTFGLTRATQTARARDLPTAALYTVAGIALWAGFALVYIPWIAWVPNGGTETLGATADQLARAATIVYASLLVWMIFYAVTVARPAPSQSGGGASVATVTAALLAAAGVAWSVQASLGATRADVFAKLGGILERAANQELAARAREEAYRLRPSEGRYAIELATSLIDRFRTRGREQATATRADLDRAESVLLRAAEANPLDPDYPANLARLFRFRAQRPGTSDRAAHFESAERSYRRSLELRPQTVTLWNELAVLNFQLGRKDEALAIFAHSLALDDRNAETYWTRAEVVYDTGDLESALPDYQRATEIRPSWIDAWSGLSATLADLGRLDESIAAAKRALEVDPENAVTHRNLVRLYRATGEAEKAAEHARRAMQAPQPDDRRRAGALIRQLGLQPETPR